MTEPTKPAHTPTSGGIIGIFVLFISIIVIGALLAFSGR
jgi:hypothetical protein